MTEGDVETVFPHVSLTDESWGKSSAEVEADIMGGEVVVVDVRGGGVEKRWGFDEGDLRGRKVVGEETYDVGLYVGCACG